MYSFILKTANQLKKAFLYSVEGLSAAFKDEFAFQLEVYVGFIALPLACLIGNNALERVALFSSYVLVPIIELLNSALETALNRINREWHELTKKAKDIGSAAVFLAIVNALVVWIIIVISHY